MYACANNFRTLPVWRYLATNSTHYKKCQKLDITISVDLL